MHDCPEIQSVADQLYADAIHDMLAYGRVIYRVDADGTVEQVSPSLVGWDDEEEGN